jgi:hypothetical protein
MIVEMTVGMTVGMTATGGVIAKNVENGASGTGLPRSE